MQILLWYLQIRVPIIGFKFPLHQRFRFPFFHFTSNTYCTESNFAGHCANRTTETVSD